MFITILVFLIILGTLVFVHELGHFVLARRNGVTAEEFGFGFPPRLAGLYKNNKGKWCWVFGNKEIEKEVRQQESTVYSINLIPLGGFVKIYGENGEGTGDNKSFVSKSIWTRFKILFAGVVMNFILGIFLLSLAFWIGLPKVIDDAQISPNAKVQIIQISAGSPAQEAGIQAGDEVKSVVIKNEIIPITGVGQLQTLITENAGQEMIFNVIRSNGKSSERIKATPRAQSVEGEGRLGVVLVKTVLVRHSLFESVSLAFETTGRIIWAILSFVGDFFAKIFTGQKIAAEVAGPVGIAVLTGQVSKLGLAYLLQFAAMLSINLGVINLLPFPALDGGRILFLIIEKIKGKPVSQKIEGIIHAAGFFILLTLMLLVTIKDFSTFNIVEKIMNIF